MGGFLRRALAALWLAACATGPRPAVEEALGRGDVAAALKRYAAEPEPDPASLSRIAQAVLEQELTAKSAERRRAALSAVSLAGNHARPLLMRMAETEPDLRVRAAVLEVLTRLGDGAARVALRKRLASGDPALVAPAVAAVEPGELEVLLPLLDAPAAAVREAALARLADAPRDAPLRLRLVDVVRQDPSARARSLAVVALSAQGPEAARAIEAALAAEELPLRLSAVRALVALDPARARVALDRWLASDPTHEGIEAARRFLLTSTAPTDAVRLSRALLARALEDHDASLRARAAVAVGSLPSWHDAALLHRRLDQEPVRAVRLSLALALGLRASDAWLALVRLQGEGDVVAVQAAAELARDGHRPALEALERLSSAKSVVVRRTAVRAWVMALDHAHPAREALLDRDPSVRLAAAAAIVAST